MVVEDDADVVRLLQFRLEKEGFEVTTHGDGAAALKVAEVECPDLILMDIMMPLMDGIETLRQIKSRRATAKIPVIMLTARADRIAVEETREMGAVEYIVKPFDPEKLVQRVRKALKMPSEG